MLPGFFRADVVEAIRAESLTGEAEAFYSDAEHNVYLTPPDPTLPDDHPRNRRVVSTKGCITDRQVPADSPLRTVYDSARFRSFLAGVVDVDEIHPYADDVSSINVHFAGEGRELGWHFDNSSFAVTMLIQAPDDGGRFEYVPALRRSGEGDDNHDGVGDVLDGRVEPNHLTFDPGDLVLFRGRDALHRVTPTGGSTTRILVVFAYNTEPGIGLSNEAKALFYGLFTAEVSSDRRSVSLVAGKQSMTFNRFWLRDNCPSLPTKDSGMRTFSVATLPEDLTVAAATVDGFTLTVDWSDGHRSEFDVDQLATLSEPGLGRRPPLPPPRRFDATHRPARFDLEQLEPGSLPHHDLLDTVANDGIALVDNIADSDDATETLAALFGRIRHTDFGRVFNIVTEPEAWTLSQSTLGQDPHTDDPYRYHPSGITILHCRRAATGGGKSILVDGFKVADDIRRTDPEAFELLATVSIPYVRHRTAAVDQGEDVHMIAYAPVISVNGRGELMGIRFHERSTGVFDLDPAIVDRYYLAFRRFAAGVRSPENQLVHKLAEGEAAVVDNQRVLHGRTDFGDDVEGRRHLRLCSIDRDQVHSRLRRLKEVHGVGPVDQRLSSGAVPD